MFVGCSVFFVALFGAGQSASFVCLFVGGFECVGNSYLLGLGRCWGFECVGLSTSTIRLVVLVTDQEISRRTNCLFIPFLEFLRPIYL